MDDAYRKLRKSRKLNDIILQSLFLPIIEVFPILSDVIFSLNQILTFFILCYTLENSSESQLPFRFVWYCSMLYFFLCSLFITIPFFVQFLCCFM